MSRVAKLTLAGSSLFALSTIVFVHYTQQAEKTVRLPLPSCQPAMLQMQLAKLRRERERREADHAPPGNAPGRPPRHGAAATEEGAAA